MTDILNTLALLANFVIVPAAAYGSQLALSALGITLIYSILRFSNFAHGEVMSIGAMAAVIAIWGFEAAGIDIHPVPTAVLALPAAVLAAVLTVLAADKLAFSYYRRQHSHPVVFMIVSVGAETCPTARGLYSRRANLRT
ncbi:MAG: ABC transporter permease subunit [Rhodospirillales bacterium]